MKLKKQQMGIALLVVGVALLAWGFTASDSLGSQLSQTFNGMPNDRAMILFLLGGISTAFGLFKLLK
ncbi:MAG: DUF3185 family protein [Gammaproteobacteria bacterium]|nr:DUF3185 family protein [Gammaproteobacteria bacterium]